MLEKWKPIKGYERYEISSIGNVRYSQNIKACADGITKSCAGYKWEYSRKVGG